MKKYVKKLIHIGIMLVILLFLFAACTPWHGIPKGMYCLADENGAVYGDGGEFAWVINKNEAEYRYLKYKIIEEDGKLYFEFNMPEDSRNGMRYEASYDGKTKILTVNMPTTEDSKEPLHYPDPEREITAFHWKKAGISKGIYIG
jgi:hypothetical protein